VPLVKILENVVFELVMYSYISFCHADINKISIQNTSKPHNKAIQNSISEPVQPKYTPMTDPQIHDSSLKICRPPGNGQIPSIAWKERSDWINVKTDVNPPARGDGTKDDTIAIQTALNMIGEEPGDPKVVYFPAGKYQISKTLSLSKRNGAMIIGHGRDTQIFWNGAKGKRMFWSNGVPRITYNGFILDGKGLSSVGIDHDSKSLYETRVIHENIEFRNFTIAGIRVGHNQKLASAEMLFTNLKFVNNKHGALFQSWNDYNNVFDGCHFINNEFGINAEKGNVTVRNSRFENSKQSDLLLSTHSHSARRVISTGSNTFIQTVRGPISNSLIKVQDSLISNWKNPDGAIVTQLRGPISIFDTNFINPPDSSPPIILNNPPYMNQLAVLSNVVSKQTKSVINNAFNTKTIIITRQKSPPPLLREDQQFLRSEIIQPDLIIDAKDDCGAVGNGLKDDTIAIQKCFEMADKTRTESLVYFPSGTYNISKTLVIPDDASFTIDGTGWHSRLVWTGKVAGTLLHVNNPSGLKIMHLALGGASKTTTLLQTGTKPGWVRYHNVFGFHDDEQQDVEIVFDSLPKNTIVLSDHMDGRIRISNSSEATMLLGNIISVQMTIEGESQQTGFLGILSRTSALEKFPLIIKNNQSLTMTDWYNEQTNHLLSMEGSKGKYGKVIIDHSEAATSGSLITKIQNYSGLLIHMGGMFGLPINTGPVSIESDTTSDIEITLLANMYWQKPPKLINNNRKHHVYANSLNKGEFGPMATVDNKLLDNTSSAINIGLDAFRKLSEYDLKLNYCISPK